MTFEQRRSWMLLQACGGDSPAADQMVDTFGRLALGNLWLGRHPEACNRQLQFVANWFHHPHPDGRLHEGECDFAAMQLAHALYALRDRPMFENATRDAIVRFFVNSDFESIYPSENHALLFRTSRLLAGRLLPDEHFKAYEKAGSDLVAEDAQWLVDFIRFRARRGWGEFDSAAYFPVGWECLSAIQQHCKLPVAGHSSEDSLIELLQRLSGMMLDLLLADMVVDSINGMYCGAQGRIYPAHALDHAEDNTRGHQFVYLDMPWRGSPPVHQHMVVPLTCDYRPNPLIVRIAHHSDTIYENRERKHLHNMFDIRPEQPLEGSIRKLTYRTPGFIMGAVMQQDAYPAASPRNTLRKPPGPTLPAWYAFHQQHDWDLSFASNPRARLFTHHPGTNGEHNFWTGDLGCGCGRFFQHRATLLATYEIAPTQTHRFIHAYLAPDAFDRVEERANSIFVVAGDAYAALWFSEPYRWTDSGEWAGKEVRSEGNRHAVICRADMAAEYDSFEEFQMQFLNCARSFAIESMTLRFACAAAGALQLDPRRRLLNGEPIDLDYPTYKSPHLQSAWDSGVITMRCGDAHETYDFNHATVSH